MSALGKQRGLTLLELLVAFAIMALSIGMLYRVMGGSVRSVGDIDRYQRAVVLAQSLLSSRDAVPNGGWRQSGETAGYQWHVQSAPYMTDKVGPSIPPLYEVSIAIAWMEGRSQRHLGLTTLRPERKPSVPVRR